MRQRQHAVRVWAVRLWLLAPSSAAEGGAGSFFACVAVATSMARCRRSRSLVARQRSRGGFSVGL